MGRFLCILFSATALTLPVLAAPLPCATGTAADYFALGSVGCTQGLFTLKNFTWYSAEGSGFQKVLSSQVDITPTSSVSGVNVAFTSDAFVVSGFNDIFARLNYTIDPPPPILDDFDLVLDANSPIAPANATITTLICAGDFFYNSCSSGETRLLKVQHFGDGNPANIFFDKAAFLLTNIIDVQTTIELKGNGSTSQIGGYGQTAAASAPEPATAALFAASGLALLFLRRRR